MENILFTLNIVLAIIAVALVKKLPADLENMKLSWETPIPRAPPSDFCNKIKIIKRIANIMFNVRSIFSMVIKYNNFLIYQ